MDTLTQFWYLYDHQSAFVASVHKYPHIYGHLVHDSRESSLDRFRDGSLIRPQLQPHNLQPAPA